MAQTTPATTREILSKSNFQLELTMTHFRNWHAVFISNLE